jgi:hypothetical protein
MKIELTIPTTLNDIKLAQYQKFLSIAKDNEESEFLQQKMVQLFCGIDLKDVAQIRYKDVAEITANINNLFTKENKFIQRFKMGGVEFGFIPNLDEMSTGEYMDLDTYITDWDTMHNAMAVLYRPITNKLGNKYQIEEYKGSVTYADVMRHAPLDVVLGAMVFFYNLGNDLLKSTINYLEGNQEVQNILTKHNLENVGDGIQVSMLLLKETLEDLMKFPSYQSHKV